MRFGQSRVRGWAGAASAYMTSCANLPREATLQLSTIRTFRRYAGDGVVRIEARARRFSWSVGCLARVLVCSGRRKSSRPLLRVCFERYAETTTQYGHENHCGRNHRTAAAHGARAIDYRRSKPPRQSLRSLYRSEMATLKSGTVHRSRRR